MQQYTEFLTELSQFDYHKACLQFLQKVDQYFVNDYSESWSGVSIVGFESNGYTYLFDLTFERVVGVYGIVTVYAGPRDASRMQGFIPQFTSFEPYKGYDRGHFVAHTLNGSLDQNLYPQLKELNRGWSEEGKKFRSMERYCANNPSCTLFTRPLYQDDTWIPTELEYGIYTTSQEWRFCSPY